MTFFRKGNPPTPKRDCGKANFCDFLQIRIHLFQGGMAVFFATTLKATLSFGLVNGIEMSNEKRSPGCLGYMSGIILPSYVGIISGTMIRIPIKQPVNWKVYIREFFSWLKYFFRFDSTSPFSGTSRGVLKKCFDMRDDLEFFASDV